MKTRTEPTPDLFPAEEMTYNPAVEYLQEMTEEEWERYCETIIKENRRKIRETHAHRNSISPFNR